MSAAASSSSAPPSPTDESLAAEAAVDSLTHSIATLSFRARHSNINTIAIEVARWMCDAEERAQYIWLPRDHVEAAVNAVEEMRAKLAALTAPVDESGAAVVATEIYTVLRECDGIDDFNNKMSNAPGVMTVTTGKNGQFARSHSFNSAVSSAVLRSDTNREVGGSIPVCSQMCLSFFSDLAQFVTTLPRIDYELDEQSVNFVSPFDGEAKRISKHGQSANGARTALRDAYADLEKCEADLRALCERRLTIMKNIIELEIKNKVYRAFQKDKEKDKRHEDEIKVQMQEERASMAKELREMLNKKRKELEESKTVIKRAKPSS